LPELPKSPKSPKSKVRIGSVRKTAALEPLAANPETWFAKLKKIHADPKFMKERRQPKTPKRTGFK
jgi:virulence-associated protein VagC